MLLKDIKVADNETREQQERLWRRVRVIVPAVAAFACLVSVLLGRWF
jgi:hypothetical protein